MLLLLNGTQSRLTVIHICNITGSKRTIEIRIVLLLYIEIQEVPHYLQKDFPFTPDQLVALQMWDFTHLEKPLYYFLGT